MPIRFFLILIQVLLAICLVSSAHGQSPKRLWVLQGPDKIVEYDIAALAPLRMSKVPPRLIEHPEYLSINEKGQMLFLPPKGAQWASGEMATAGDRMWFWDGRRAREWGLGGAVTSGGSKGEPTITETALQWFLSADGKSLFWFENRFEKVTDEAGSLDRSVRTAARVWRTDFAGHGAGTIANLSSSGWCSCTTGTCSESCPEWSFWAPDGVVGDFFVATQVTPGQLGSTYHESLLYRRSGRKWIVEKLPQPLEVPLTASAKGERLFAAIADGGCCGWENEGSDQMLLLRKGKVSTIYDEFDRYGNRDYDVSFYPADARFLSGRDAMLAYTVVSTSSSEREVRLSSEGRENPEELARVRKAISEAPVVEVVRLDVRPRLVTTISHAALVGWLSSREILVAQDKRLKVYDIHGKKRKETPIRVRSAADAFLR